MTTILETSTLADIIRQYHGPLSRNQLKAQRARLRRAQVTNLNRARRNTRYAVCHYVDVSTDARADIGTVVAQIAATPGGQR